MPVDPANIQISLGINKTRLKSMLFTLCVARNSWILFPDNKVSHEKERMPRLIQVFARGTSHHVWFFFHALARFIEPCIICTLPYYASPIFSGGQINHTCPYVCTSCPVHTSHPVRRHFLIYNGPRWGIYVTLTHF